LLSLDPECRQVSPHIFVSRLLHAMLGVLDCTFVPAVLLWLRQPATEVAVTAGAQHLYLSPLTMAIAELCAAAQSK